MRTRFTKKYVLALFVLTCVGLAGITGGLYLIGREPIWHADDLSETVNRFILYGRMMRHAISSLLSGNGFDFPPYLMTVGYGMSTSSTIGGTMGDPLNLLSIICPSRYAEFMYIALIYVRVILAAFSFSFYSLQRGNSRSASLVASLCYALSGFIVFWGVLRHPLFLISTVYLPLALAGADRVFAREKSWLFVVVMALQFLVSTYFAYMLCITLLAYCLVKYFSGERDRSVKDFVLLVAKFAALLVVAFAIAAVASVAKVAAIGSQSRLSLTRYSPMLYDLSRYLDLPGDLIGASTRTKGAYFGAVGILLVIVFLVCRKHFDPRTWRSWCIALVLVVLCTCLPFLSRIYNGFTYATDRWMPAAAFCSSYIVCLVVPVLKQLDRKDWVKVGVTALALIACCIAGTLVQSSTPSRKAVIMIALFAAVFFIMVIASRKLGRQALSLVLAVCVIGGISVSSELYCLPKVGSGFASGLMKIGTVRNVVFSGNPAAAIEKLDDDSLFRYSLPGAYNSFYNSTLNHSVSAIDFYSSTYAQPVDDLRSELGLSDDYFNIRFAGSESRYAIDALTGAKYYAAKESHAWRVPSPYEQTDTRKGEFAVWKTDHYLPLAFSTGRAVDKSAYQGLSMAEKQEALLQGCVIEDDAAPGIERVENIDITSQDVPCTLEGSNDVILEDGKIIALKADASVTLTFEGTPSSETYVKFENLDYTSYLPSELAKLKGKDASGKEMADLLSSYPSGYQIVVESAGKKRTYSFGTNRQPQYGGKHNWILNTGYTEEGKTKAKLTFSRAGGYTYDDLSIVCQPTQPLVEKVDALAGGGATEMSFDGSTVSGSFNTTDDHELAVFTLPYAKGWTATVDGEPAELLRADTAFMGVELEGPGKHVVRLTYADASLPANLMISLAGIAALALIVYFERKRAR